VGVGRDPTPLPHSSIKRLGPRSLLMAMAIILPHSPPCSNHGGREMAWRTVDDAPSTVLVSADTPSMMLVSAGDGRPVFTSVRTVLLSSVLTSRGVVAHRPIGEALSHPSPVAAVPTRDEAWAIGHVHRHGFYFDR